MADTSGQAEIRGIDIDKLAKGYEDREYILKKYLNVSSTSSREIRWYKRTAGTLDATDPAQIENTDQLALPTVIEQSVTRQTSYVRKYFVESPTISEEDIKDADIDMLGMNMRALVLAVTSQVETRMFNVITESLSPTNINTAAAQGTGWDDTTNGDPIEDIMTAKKNIKSYNYPTDNLVMYMNQHEELMLLNWLISTKGSSIPQYSSQRVVDGAVLEILGVSVVVSPNATTDYALIFVPQRAATWRSFTPIRSVLIDEPLIGKKIRVSEEGECLLTDPKAVHLITDTTT